VGPTFEWRGTFTNREVNCLHAEAFGHELFKDRWLEQVQRWSLGWVTARNDGDLVGFVNVPWDGFIHAFIIDVIVADTSRRAGVGTRLVEVATEQARTAGCEWLHVDFDDDLAAFYFESCGFQPTKAGLIRL
jgi:ribosomal protein S18 acetylase RimI-like enzyme